MMASAQAVTVTQIPFLSIVSSVSWRSSGAGKTWDPWELRGDLACCNRSSRLAWGPSGSWQARASREALRSVDLSAWVSSLSFGARGAWEPWVTRATCHKGITSSTTWLSRRSWSPFIAWGPRGAVKAWVTWLSLN